ncbi:SGNH/GDSL hydrolase family protein [Jejuia spongiicola]|uniref:SGNH/GDSL hydrolase family protein n=1 Tax=Jejuia spongiicola TaxID=2942207 RepID=A0ABT0QA53_9FLAO|nr:SGNH/GDSL hydrolase family protein [Jejuia spongiicola]MCL6293865.1 SGNH/GDSL hydrolase family protein [Jejuia spongiicola]
MKKIVYLIVICTTINLSCTVEKSVFNQEEIQPNQSVFENQDTYKILALGDSYTIGESVCQSCRFPEQLKDNLKQEFESSKEFKLKIIARTGWTTSNLLTAIDTEKPSKDYDLVTLLIGVNNQYQGKPFNVYKKEFIQLTNKAIECVKGNKKDIIIISIPDYAYTPFGNGNQNVSKDIDRYNDFAKNYCGTNNLTYVNITDITRKGLQDSNLVASDGLHPSKLAYSKFVERLLPIALDKLKN